MAGCETGFEAVVMGRCGGAATTGQRLRRRGAARGTFGLAAGKLQCTIGYAHTSKVGTACSGTGRHSGCPERCYLQAYYRGRGEGGGALHHLLGSFS